MDYFFVSSSNHACSFVNGKINYSFISFKRSNEKTLYLHPVQQQSHLSITTCIKLSYLYFSARIAQMAMVLHECSPEVKVEIDSQIARLFSDLKTNQEPRGFIEILADSVQEKNKENTSFRVRARR